MDTQNPKPYKPNVRTLKPSDGASRLGTRAKPTGKTMRGRQLLSRSEAHLDKVLDELQTYKGEVARLKGLLEGIVRTHGEQALDGDFLNESCTEGNIVIEFRAPNFVVVKLAPPKLVEPPAPVPQFPPSDDPFVANLSPNARIAYEAAYAKAKEEEAGMVRLK
jgi:hypothetical protein